MNGVLDVLQRGIELEVLLNPEPVLLVSCGIGAVDVGLVHHRVGGLLQIGEPPGSDRATLALTGMRQFAYNRSPTAN